MKNTAPKNKSKSGARAASKPNKPGVEHKKSPPPSLKDSENNYRSLFKNMLNGLAYCRMIFEQGRPRDFIYLEVNSAFESLTGLKDVTSKKVSEVIPGIRDSDPGLFEIYGRVALSGKPERFETYVESLKMWFLISVYSPKKEYFVAVFDVITERKQAEEQLRYQAYLLNSINDAIVATDKNYAFTAWNKAAEDLYGWKAEEVFGRIGPEILQTEWPGENADEMRRRIMENGSWRGEVTQSRKDGSHVQLELATYMMHDANGEPAGYVSVNRDIHERKRAEEQIKSLAKFPDENPSPVLRLNDQGVILYANPASRSVLEDWKTSIGRKAPDFWQKKVIEVLGGQIQQVVDIPIKGRTLSFVISPVIEAGYVNIYAQDITERKLAEESLNRANQRLQRFFESNIIGIVLADPAGNILEANDYYLRLIGYTRRDLEEGRVDWRAITPAEWLPADDQAIQELRERGTCTPYEKEYLLRDGRRVPVLLTDAMLSGPEEQLVAFVLDISQLKQAEAEIESLAKFPDENPYPILRLSDTGIILYANSASRKLLEDWETDIGRPVPAFWLKKVTEVITSRTNQVVDISLGERFLSFVIAPVVEAGYVNLYGRDITARKKVEEELRRSEDLYHRLFENIHETFIVQELVRDDAGNPVDLRYVEVNPAAELRLGRARSELVGRTRSQISGQPDPEGVELAGQVLSTGQPKHLVRYSPGFEGWFESTTYSLGSGLVATLALDITERKRAEEVLQKAHDELELQVQQRTAALSQSNMLLQTLLDNMPDQIYFKDARSRFIKNSRAQAAQLGLSDPSQVVGRTDFDFFPHAQRSFDEEQEIIRSGKPMVDFEEWVVWPDGHDSWVSTTKVPLRDQENKIIGTLGISRDITDRKRNEDALRKARDELEAFSYSVSHDLRAPLRGIDGWSLALMEDYGGKLDEQGQEYIRRVRSETQHMGDLIDDLLQLSRITRAEMHSDRVDLSALARSIVERLRDGEPHRQVEFIIQSGLSAVGDAHLLDILLTNLLGNAFKFTGKTPSARIEFGQMNQDGQRVFFVSDNGAGFDMDYANKLFGAFQRMHKTSEFPGTGIGLAIVQRIINRHGGRVWAEAVVDQGATFFFTL